MLKWVRSLHFDAKTYRNFLSRQLLDVIDLLKYTERDYSNSVTLALGQRGIIFNLSIVSREFFSFMNITLYLILAKVLFDWCIVYCLVTFSFWALLHCTKSFLKKISMVNCTQY